MIETKEKYDFKSQIKKLEDYIRKVEFSIEDMKQLNRVLFKLRNIEAITCNLDEELYNVLIDVDYDKLDTYCNDFVLGNHNNLVNLQNATNSIINNLLRYVDFNLMLGNKSEIKNSIRNYKYEITRQNNLIDKEISEFKTILQEKRDNIEKEDSNLSMLFTSFNNKLDDLEKKYSTLENNIEELIKQSKEDVTKLIETEKIKLGENYSKESDNYKIKFEEKSKEYQTKFDDLYTTIEAKDEQISKLLDIVGEKARIGEYKKNADSARTERIVWQVITVFLFLAAFIIMTCVTLGTKNYDKFTVFKYIVSAILMGAATYTGRQASNLRKDEVYYRKQELELASIDVYLENMNSDNKEEIKKELSSKLFGQAQNTYTNKYDEKKNFSVEDIIKILETIKNNN